MGTFSNVRALCWKVAERALSRTQSPCDMPPSSQVTVSMTYQSNRFGAGMLMTREKLLANDPAIFGLIPMALSTGPFCRHLVCKGCISGGQSYVFAKKVPR